MNTRSALRHRAVRLSVPRARSLPGLARSPRPAGGARRSSASPEPPRPPGMSPGRPAHPLHPRRRPPRLLITTSRRGSLRPPRPPPPPKTHTRARRTGRLRRRGGHCPAFERVDTTRPFGSAGVGSGAGAGGVQPGGLSSSETAGTPTGSSSSTRMTCCPRRRRVSGTSFASSSPATSSTPPRAGLGRAGVRGIAFSSGSRTSERSNGRQPRESCRPSSSSSGTSERSLGRIW